MFCPQEVWKSCLVLQGPEDLLLVRKLDGQEVVANTSSGQPGQLACVVDQRSGLEYLVDTGSVYSLIPLKSKEKQSGPTSAQQTVSHWHAEVTRPAHYVWAAAISLGDFYEQLWPSPS